MPSPIDPGSASASLQHSNGHGADASSENNGICDPHQFAFECASTNCCASYHQRFLLLLGSLGIFAVAILVLLVWMSLQWRPRQWRRSHGAGGKRISEVELKSCEETRYLRRMSELNPNARREIVE